METFFANRDRIPKNQNLSYLILATSMLSISELTLSESIVVYYNRR